MTIAAIAPDFLAVDRIVGSGEAAAIVGVSPPTIRVFALRGTLPGRQFDGRLFFRAADCERLRIERERGAAEAGR